MLDELRIRYTFTTVFLYGDGFVLPVSVQIAIGIEGRVILNIACRTKQQRSSLRLVIEVLGL
jgi:hypothetical protein